MSGRRWQGVFTALVTPFGDGGAVDFERFRRLVDRQLEAGVQGLVPCGTTGETPALEASEWERLIAIAVERAGGQVPVIAGTGTNSTAATIARTRRARELGADAALVVTPYYNKPNPAGLERHYRAVADEGGLPIVFYNVPSRTGLNATPEILGPIASLDAVEAVKEASGSLGQAMTLIRERPGGIAVLSGEDELTCPMVLMGGDGVISVVSNIDPEGTVRMVRAALAGDAGAAREEHERLLPLVRALFCETNPVPAKAALARLGLAEDRVRPLLAPASRRTRERLDAALREAGLAGGAA